MNLVKQQMFVNIITKNIDILNIDDVNPLCSKIIFHLKYNKILSKIGDDYFISILPVELSYIKKFIRKITYYTKDKSIAFFPVNEDIDIIIIYK